MAVAVLVFIVVFTYIYLDSKGSYDRVFGSFLPAVFIAFLAGIMMMIPGAFIRHVPNPYTVELVTLRDNISSGGSFFLGIGSIKDDYVYSSWYRSGEAVKHFLVNESAHQVQVFQDTTPETAYLQVNRNTCESGWWDWIVICLDDRDSFDFHVPPGTVYQEFNLNN